MPTIAKFEDLPVWQAARKLAVSLYELTRQQPFCDDWGLCRQLQRTAVSVLSNIAEGFERGSKTEFIQFLFIAKGSAGEARAQLYIAFDLNYITAEQLQKTVTHCEQVSRQLAGLIEYLKQSEFKGHKFREPQAEYEIDLPQSEI